MPPGERRAEVLAAPPPGAAETRKERICLVPENAETFYTTKLILFDNQLVIGN
jgi:hypothetical protein